MDRAVACINKSTIHHPNVAVADGIAVVLEVDGAGAFFAFESAEKRGGRMGYVQVLVDHHAVVADGHAGVFDLLAVFVEARCSEDDVVGLPLERRGAHVDPGSGDAVDSPTLVRAALEAVTVEDLDLVASLEIDAAVSAALSPGLGLEGGAELEVDLVVSELSLRDDPPASDLHRLFFGD